MSITIKYVGSTRDDMWQEIKRLSGKHDDEPCSGVCAPEARKHVRLGPYGWTFSESKKPLGVLGVRIVYCPFCGNKLQ